MKNGLFIGRFQPFHLGHLSAIRQGLEHVEHLFIAIGSSQYSHTKDNPFTAKERAQMIETTLQEAKIKPEAYTVIKVPDIHDNPKWPAHVRGKAPSFEIVFSNSDLVRELFEKYDTAKVMPIEIEVNISASEIRNKTISNKSFKQYLPQGTIKVLGEIDGIERVKFAK